MSLSLYFPVNGCVKGLLFLSVPVIVPSIIKLSPELIALSPNVTCKVAFLTFNALTSLTLLIEANGAILTLLGAFNIT